MGFISFCHGLITSDPELVEGTSACLRHVASTHSTSSATEVFDKRGNGRFKAVEKFGQTPGEGAMGFDSSLFC